MAVPTSLPVPDPFPRVWCMYPQKPTHCTQQYDQEVHEEHPIHCYAYDERHKIISISICVNPDGFPRCVPADVDRQAARSQFRSGGCWSKCWRHLSSLAANVVIMYTGPMFVFDNIMDSDVFS